MIILYSLVIAALAVQPGYGVRGGVKFSKHSCTTSKMKALHSAYNTNVKILELKSDLENDLMDLVMEAPETFVGYSQPAIPVEDRVMKERQLSLYREKLEDLVRQLETGKIVVPENKDLNRGVFAQSVSRLTEREIPDFSIDRYVGILKQINASDEILEAWYKFITLDREDKLEARTSALIMPGVSMGMNCGIKPRSDTRPTSVRRLRPGDIDVIGAMGDSITAGFGSAAKFLFVWQWFYEFRGNSWSAGGDNSYEEGQTTLPNILRQFNPNLKGYSEGTVKLNQDPKASPNIKLNVAITGSEAADLPAQARHLVQKLQLDDSIDMQHDWKMVTLFIGGNDLCRFCTDRDRYAASQWVSEIKDALDILKAQVPRLFVNLVEIFDIVPLTEMAKFKYGTIICSLAHSLADVCSCVRDQDDYDYKFDAETLKQLSADYQEAVNNLVNSGRYDDKDDFAVVIQPFFRNTAPPVDEDGDPDMSYFAQDCFHFSNKGQNRAGRGLWNSIIQPVGQKSVDWEMEDPVECPKVEYLPTKQNSR